MSGILDSVIGAASSQLSSSLTQRLGESPDAIKKGIETGTATLLGGIANNANDSGFMSKIFSLATNANVKAAAGAGGGSSSVGELGSTLLSSVFGSQQSSIMDTIGRVSGLRSGSGSSLMTSLAPMVLGFLGSHIASNGLNLSSFTNLFRTEASSISRLVPAGINFPAPAPVVAQAPPVMATAIVREDKKTNWLWPLLLIGGLLLAGLLWWFNRPHEAVAPAVAETTSKMADTATKMASEVPAAWARLGDKLSKALPSGVSLNVPSNGVEAHLVDALGAPTLDTTKWYDFDRLLFDTDAATLQPASQEQLENVANILKAYPNVHVRIGGYTDNTGDAANNLKLSQDRADSVMAELVRLGVPATRMDAKGYGAEHPVADNSTEEGRQANRRVSMRLTSK